MTHVYSAPREWTRVHPVTPFLGGWAIVGLVLAYGIHQLLPGLVLPNQEQFEFFDQFPVIGVLLAAFVGLILSLALSVWGWYRTEYRIGDDAVYHRSGIVTKQQRQARLDRLQAVDVVQPLLARLFGFAQINIQVAGGANSGVDLKFLRLGDAEALRNEILYLAAGVTSGERDDAAVTDAGEASASPEAGDGPSLREQLSSRVDALGRPLDVLHGTERTATAIGAAEEREVYTVPPGRLIVSILRSSVTITLVVVILAALIGTVFFSVDVIAFAIAAASGSAIAALFAVFAFFGTYWRRFNGGYRFTAAISADGLRLRHGLTETRRQTVPPGRVQAIRLHQPLLWRSKDWWRITINVAGYGEDQESVSTLHPVATREEALLAVWLILPDLGDADPAGTLGRAMSGSGDEGGFLTSPPRARRIDPLQWRFRGVKATERALLLREGRFTRQLVVVPHERMQSLGLRQGPLDRALDLAAVVIHSTQGPVSPRVDHLAREDAIALLDAQAERGRAGRQRQTPDQWLRRVAEDV